MLSPVMEFSVYVHYEKATTVLLLWVMLSWLPVQTVARISPGGMLYPRESESREVRTLDGVWNFRLSPESDPLMGFREHWYHKELRLTGDVILMPVPSSYNDITQEKVIRDHVGLVWYDRTFYVPDTWRQQGSRVWIRFGSVNYAAQVWINGQLVMSHEIGHLPFQRDVTGVLKYGTRNLITVAVDNTLLETSVPQGMLSELFTDNGTQIVQTYTFDFFNYGGIHRSVQLYTTPAIYIDDISVYTTITEDGSGIITYNVTYNGFDQSLDTPLCYVDLLDREGNYVIRDVNKLTTSLEIPSPHLWWPYLMNPDPGYLYTLQIRLVSPQLGTKDVYRLPVGIRTVEWNNTGFTINKKPFYFRGFGKHEDSDIRGRGMDYPLIIKDFNLIKWVGGNSFRTSHYPYAEEIMDLADQQGIVVIDECPSVDTVGFTPILLQKHKDSLGELIRRDKNRPSVIMWSVANEARTHQAAADPYFKSIVDYVRSLDVSRPVTIATARGYSEDKAAQYVDIIGFNRYNAWYHHPGRTDTIVSNVVTEAESWYKQFNKPVLMLEYGADTMSGLHLYPEYIWSEEYQVELLSQHFKAFDILRRKGFFIGEMIWNFADFKTSQTYTRVGGNKKGIFTRSRQPKTGAHHLRKRYFALAKELDRVPTPVNLNYYISTTAYKDKRKNEL